jgi:hypothetical protein
MIWEDLTDIIGVIICFAIVAEMVSIYGLSKVAWTKMFLAAYTTLLLARLFGVLNVPWFEDHIRQIAVGDLVLVLIALDFLRRAVRNLTHPSWHDKALNDQNTDLSNRAADATVRDHDATIRDKHADERDKHADEREKRLDEGETDGSS